MKTLTTTEITLSLQTIVLVISVVVSATLYVNHIEEQLDVSAVLMGEKGAKWDQDSEVLRDLSLAMSESRNQVRKSGATHEQATRRCVKGRPSVLKGVALTIQQRGVLKKRISSKT